MGNGTAPKEEKSAATRKKESEEKQQQEQKLNPKQKQAVETEKPDVAVIAGPGSGKTKTLISRILSLLEERGVRPSEITAVTFTNKAAEEMRARLSVKLGAKAGKIHIGTFHSICLELLRRRGPVALLDGPQALEIAQQILTEAASKKKPRQFLQEISKQKNGLSPQTEDARAYQERLQEMEVMDFDDLLLNALKLSKAETDWKRFRYLLVDEFQDINQIQYQLIHLWKSWGGNLFVIGDPDQSIYGFRGSEAQCFRKLKEDLPELEMIYLTENYRNSPQILQSALSVIAHNGGPARQLQAYQSAGEPVKMVSTDSELGQAIFVAKEINRLTGGMDMLDYDTGKSGKERSKTYSFSEIGVLFRTHRQAALLEKCLKQESVPYIVAGGESCLEDKMVRGVLGFLRYLIFEDPQGMRSCLRLLWNCPEDLACKAADRPQECREEAFVKPFLELAEQYGEKVKKEKPRKVFDQMRKQLPWLDTPAMEQLCRMAVFHGKMDEFLQAVVLGQEADLIYGNGEKYAAGAVTLMTLHAAKGLEFSAVFLCGVSEGCIPLTAQEKDVDLQEERRLFYVGMTRAKEELYLLYQQQPSPFLQEIPLNLLEQVHRKKRVSNAQQISMFDE